MSGAAHSMRWGHRFLRRHGRAIGLEASFTVLDQTDTADMLATISTIYSAKGCEWDLVHVLHVTDGHIPSDLATGDAVPCATTTGPWAWDDAHGYSRLTRYFTASVLACLDSTQPFRVPPTRPDEALRASTSGIEAVDRIVAALWD